MTRLEVARNQIIAVRQYTVRLLDTVAEEDWFKMPAGVSHIAWQVGHLAMAEYRLALDRLRGERPSDADVISADFLALFGRGSAPEADCGRYPPPSEIRAVFDRVHEQVLAELQDIDDASLDLPPYKPHDLFNTRFGSLMWCSQHEMSHAGQIGYIRRGLGMAPRW